MVMKKNIISAKDLKKILNKKDLTVLDSRWFLKEPLRGGRSLKNHIYQMQFFLILKKILTKTVNCLI